MTPEDTARDLLKQAEEEIEKSAVLIRQKLPCPYCGGFRSRVTNSRSGAGDVGIWRRRECLSCGQRFTTEEVVRGSYKITTTSGSKRASVG